MNTQREGTTKQPAPYAFARRMAAMQPSAVREILKVAERPDILSFAGGLPAPELFPVEAIADAHARVLRDHGAAALQYSTTEGFAPLREWIAAHLTRAGVPTSIDELIITNGSQQGIDLVARIFCDAGDRIIVENPTYLAAIQAFTAYEVDLVAAPSDDHGMQTDALEELVVRHRPKLIYLVSNFQNPKGATLPLARRKKLAEIARRHDVAVLEDDPYGELVFRGERIAPIASLERRGVVQLGTFSKTLAPGLRIGWLRADAELVRKVTIVKQAADLHTATLAQRAAQSLLDHFDYGAHLTRLRAAYGARCDAMLGALERHMPRGTRWIRPDGGMFVWAQLPGGLDADGVFPSAIAEGVAFVPGSGFFVEDVRRDFVRLNYSNRPPELIEDGMARLGKVIARALGS